MVNHFLRAFLTPFVWKPVETGSRHLPGPYHAVNGVALLRRMRLVELTRQEILLAGPMLLCYSVGTDSTGAIDNNEAFNDDKNSIAGGTDLD